MYNVDRTYKTNKCRLMRDVPLLRESLDGKIPPVTANDAEQLGLLITKLKKTKNIADDSNSKELAIWANSASIDSKVNSSKHNVGSTSSTNSSKKSVGMSGCRSSDSDSIHSLSSTTSCTSEDEVSSSRRKHKKRRKEKHSKKKHRSKKSKSNVRGRHKRGQQES